MLLAHSPLSSSPLSAGPLSTGPVAITLTGAVVRPVARVAAGSITALVSINGAVVPKASVYGRLIEASINTGSVKPRAKIAGTLQMGTTLVGAIQMKPQIAGFLGNTQAMAGAVVRPVVRAVAGTLNVATVFGGAVRPQPVVAGVFRQGAGLNGSVQLKPKLAGTFVHTGPVVQVIPDAFVVGRIKLSMHAAGTLNLYTGLTGDVRPKPLVSGRFGAPLVGSIRLSPRIAGQLAIDWQGGADELWVTHRPPKTVLRNEAEALYV